MLYSVDNILLKNISNKRWVQKLYEAYPKNVNTSLGNFLMNIFNGLFYTDAGNNFIISTWDECPYIEECFESTNMSPEQIKNQLDIETNYFFNEYNLTDIEYIEHQSLKTYKENSESYVRYRPIARIEVDKTTNQSYIKGYISYTKYNSKYISQNLEKSFNKIIRSYYQLNRISKSGPQYRYRLSPDMFEMLKPYIFNAVQINQSSNIQNNYSDTSNEDSNQDNIQIDDLKDDFMINQILIKQKENIIVPTTTDTNEKSSIIWNAKIAGANQMKNFDFEVGIIPEIKTNLVITDEKFRTLNNVCDMVINNVTKMKNELPDFSKNNSRQTIFYTDKDVEQIDFFDRIWTQKEIDENNEKYPNAVQVFDSTKSQIIQARVLYAYYDMMQKIKNNKWHENIRYSRGLNYCLHNYLVEITSPMSIIDNAITWNELNGTNGLEVLKQVVGINESEFKNNSFIMYPLNQSNPLADSHILLNHKLLKVSTKGGLNGKGAYASIKSLREYVFEGEKGKGNITKFGMNIKNEYPDLFNIFDILTNKSDGASISEAEWKKMYDSIQNINGGVPIHSYKDIATSINSKGINHKWTKMIMKILESASYDFIQVNAKASNAKSKAENTIGDFYFTYTAQYPAVFDGKVKLKLSETGNATFHIEE